MLHLSKYDLDLDADVRDEYEAMFLEHSGEDSPDQEESDEDIFIQAGMHVVDDPNATTGMDELDIEILDL